MIVKADKSNNLYRVPVKDYKKLVDNNVTSKYKLSNDREVMKVNKEAAKIAENLNIGNRVDRYIKSNAFITVKDHKDNFPSKIECRLLNPAKSNIGSKMVIFDYFQN